MREYRSCALGLCALSYFVDGNGQQPFLLGAPSSYKAAMFLHHSWVCGWNASGGVQVTPCLGAFFHGLVGVALGVE